MEYDTDKMLASLNTSDWSELEQFYKRMVDHKDNFSEYTGEEVNADGIIELGYTKVVPLGIELMRYFYDKKLVVPFNWGSWDEGRKILKRKGENKFDDISSEDTLKLFTAIMRNDRFCEGAWGSFLDSGDATRLLKHLLSYKPRDAVDKNG